MHGDHTLAELAAPASSTVTTDLTCPLCEYSLRGLTEPRCPECGFAFAWAELLDDRRTRHRWLFEHGRRRSLRTFLATFVADAFPRRFWRSITPANPVHLGRLLAYWVTTAVLAIALAVGIGPVTMVARLAYANNQQRAMYAPVPGSPGMFALRTYSPPVKTAQLIAWYPLPWELRFWSNLFDEIRQPGRRYGGPRFDALAEAGAVLVAWPWLSMVALLVFQASMRRAKVRPSHVLRVAVYSCDCSLLAAVVLAGYQPLWLLDRFYYDPYWSPIPLVNAATLPVLLVLITCASAATYRMSLAYRLYLRFDRPVLTVLAAQAMALLAVCFLLTKLLPVV